MAGHSSTSAQHSMRILGGAAVSFKEGASVFCLSFPSDDTSQPQSNFELGMSLLQLTSVTCTWSNPSKSATLMYRNEEDSVVIDELEEDGIQLHGRYLKISRQSRLVSVWNLDTITAEKDITPFFPPLRMCILHPPTHEMDEKQLHDAIKTLMDACGTIVDWEVTTHNGKVKAVVRFEKAEMARKAIKDLNGKTMDSKSRDCLIVTEMVSVVLSVPSQVLEVIKPWYDALEKSARVKDDVKIKTFEGFCKDYSQIRIQGESRVHVAKYKSRLESALAGKVVKSNDNPIQHEFFFGSSSTDYLASLMNVCAVFVSRDPYKMLLRLHGQDSQIRAAEHLIVTKLRSLQMTRVQKHNIILDESMWPIAVNGGFHQIVMELGKDKAAMPIDSDLKRIVITGENKDATQALSILHERSKQSFGLQMKTPSVQPEVLCTVCWTPSEDPFPTSCGHFCCRLCLASQCNLSSGSQFPISCLGESATCNRPLKLEELKQCLSPLKFEAMLQASLKNYIRFHSGQFRYCPTPDCNYFYRISSMDHPQIFDCHSCLNSVCTACHQPMHEDITCEALKAFKEDNVFKQWKQANDVRDCPNCSTPIQKTFGCNHMNCGNCRSHICWYCMKNFDTSEQVYRHLSSVHGGIGMQVPVMNPANGDGVQLMNDDGAQNVRARFDGHRANANAGRPNYILPRLENRYARVNIPQFHRRPVNQDARANDMPFYHGPANQDARVNNMPFYHGPANQDARVNNMPFYHGPANQDARVNNMPFYRGPANEDASMNNPQLRREVANENARALNDPPPNPVHMARHEMLDNIRAQGIRMRADRMGNHNQDPPRARVGNELLFDNFENALGRMGRAQAEANRREDERLLRVRNLFGGRGVGGGNAGTRGR